MFCAAQQAHLQLATMSSGAADSIRAVERDLHTPPAAAATDADIMRAWHELRKVRDSRSPRCPAAPSLRCQYTQPAHT